MDTTGEDTFSVWYGGVSVVYVLQVETRLVCDVVVWVWYMF